MTDGSGRGSTGRRLSHLDEHGAARMVDVSTKSPSARIATASGVVHTTAAVVGQISIGGVSKGDVLATARIAAIQAAKRTSELIPLCHQIPLSSISVEFTVTGSAVQVVATARSTDRTGVEMEALTAVAVGTLTVYDMIKALDPAARIDAIHLVRKEGGKAGVWEAPR